MSSQAPPNIAGSPKQDRKDQAVVPHPHDVSVDIRQPPAEFVSSADSYMYFQEIQINRHLSYDEVVVSGGRRSRTHAKYVLKCKYELVFIIRRIFVTLEHMEAAEK